LRTAVQATTHAWAFDCRARYPSGAVLGGELAVPCTCNPL